jgi:hypothetical protein
MTSRLKAENAASNEKNVMWRRLFSYYYTHMIQVGAVWPIFARFKYRS